MFFWLTVCMHSTVVCYADKLPAALTLSHAAKCQIIYTNCRRKRQLHFGASFASALSYSVEKALYTIWKSGTVVIFFYFICRIFACFVCLCYHIMS